MATNQTGGSMNEPAPGRRLGRGLAALIGDVSEDTSAAPARSRGIRTVPVAFLRPNPHNPRRTFSDDALADLAASIREKGVVQPLVVRESGGGMFEIVAGERRWRAAQKAGLHDVPVVVRNLTDREALEIAIVENVQRADLNPIEEAVGYRQLLDEHGYSQDELAKVVGKSRPHISNTLRLLRLPPEVQAYVKDGKLSAGHARALVTHPNPGEAARRIVEEGLSVRAVEAEAAETAARPRKPRVSEPKDADTLALEKSLADSLGLSVSINHGGEDQGGSVRVSYKTLEQLDEITRRLKTS